LHRLRFSTRNSQAATCSRCGADLAPLLLLIDQAHRLRQYARKAIETGDVGEPKSWRKRLSPSAPRRKDGSCGSSVRGSCLALNLRLNLYGSLSDKTLPRAFEFQPTMGGNLIEVRIHEVFPPLMRLTTHEWHLHPGEHGRPRIAKNCGPPGINLRVLHTTDEHRQHPRGGKLYLSLMGAHHSFQSANQMLWVRSPILWV
jgi:hypothetical protein